MGLPSSPSPPVSGLDGIVVAETRLSRVDGVRGRLVIAGHDVARFADRHRFETACDALVRSGIGRQIGAARVDAFRRLPDLGAALDDPDAMAALRGAIGQLGAPADDLDSAVSVIGAMGVFACAWARRRGNLPAIEPDPDADHASDLLRMMRGSRPRTEEARALDRYLVTVSDHGMNASTFAARVVASTRSDLVSAVTAALGALRGPLHGGAPGPVLDMLDAIGAPERARPWLEAELRAGRRIMGMGHRVYRVRDPRAGALEETVIGLGEVSDDLELKNRLALARTVEGEAEKLLADRHPARELRANVEFYTALLLEALGCPRALFTAMFATGRVVGWCGHVLEQRRTGRLIRPLAKYVGSEPVAAVS